MASLLDTIRKNKKRIKIGGQLQEVSDEGLQNLSALQERPTTPNTPQGASGIGASPDSAKMAGTPANQLSTIKIATQQDSQLPTFQRTQQDRLQKSAEERQQANRALSLEGLGSLRGRVQQLAASKLTAAQTPTQLSIDETKLADIAPELQETTTEALTRLGSGQGTPQDVLAVNQALGRTTAGEQLSSAELVKLFEPPAASLGQDLANQTADNVSVSDLNAEQLQTLGFDSLESLGAALNISEDEVGTYTISELSEEVNLLQQEEFARTAELQRRATDPNLGPAEREEARRLLREVGATGVRSVENSMEDLAAELQSADQVEFDGEILSVEELLSDEKLTSVVKDFIDNPELAEKLRKTEPDFAEWIDRNRTAMEELTSGIESQATEFASIQEFNESINKTNSGETINDVALKEMIPGYGELQTERLAIPPFVEVMKNSPNLTTAVNNLAETNPEVLKEFAAMSNEALFTTGFNTPQAVQQYGDYLSTVKMAQTTSGAASPNTLIAGLFAEGPEDATAAKDRLNETLSSARAFSTSGFASFDEDILNLLDADGDGQLDDPEEVRKRVVGEGAISPAQMAAAGLRPTDLQTPSQLVQRLTTSLSEFTAANPFEASLKEAYKDGSLSRNDVTKFVTMDVNNPIKSIENLDNLIKNAQNVEGGAREALVAKSEEAARSYLSQSKASPDEAKSLVGQLTSREPLRGQEEINKATTLLEKMRKISEDNSLPAVVKREADKFAGELSNAINVQETTRQKDEQRLIKEFNITRLQELYPNSAWLKRFQEQLSGTRNLKGIL